MIRLLFVAAFMITKEVYFDLSGINDFRVRVHYLDNIFNLDCIAAYQSTFNKATISFWDYSKRGN